MYKRQMHDRYLAVDLENAPDIGTIAKAYGIEFIQVKDMQDAEAAIETFISNKGPCIMECNIHPFEGTFEDR